MDYPTIDLWNEPSPFQNSQAYEQKNHNWDVLRNYGQYIGNYLNGIIDSWNVRFAAQLQQIPQPSELIDARVDQWGHTYSTLHDHLVNIEANTIHAAASQVQADDRDQISTTLQVTDLTTTSYNLRYRQVGAIQFVMPKTAYGTTTTSKLMVAPY